MDHPRPSDGHTPLYLAASHGQLDCCKVLIEGGASIGTRMKSSIEGYVINSLEAVCGCDMCHAPTA